MKAALSDLRQAMKAQDIDVFIIPSSDPHQGEYVADHWKIREWLSNFTGSAGTLVITAKHAGLWTDSRYFIQGEQELASTPFELHKQIKPKDHYLNWIVEHTKQREVIGFDGRLFSLTQLRTMKKKFAKKKLEIKATADLMTNVWTEDRPAMPSTKIFIFDQRYAGLSRKDKIDQVRTKMKDIGTDWLLISTLDDIAWTLNLRGRDVNFNPVFYSFLLIGERENYLFINPEKLTQAIQLELDRDSIFIENYDRAYNLHDICVGKICVDPDDCNIALYNQFRAKEVIEKPMPTRMIKAQKTQIEVQHIENAMVKDGIALTNAFYWLEQNVASGGVTEYDFAQKIAECRSKQEGYFGESFPAIIGYEGNGAIVHYRPAKDTSKTIESKGMLLCDSGGQYIDGTTDITRTIAMGEVTEKQKRHYTLVLKGHIALDTIRFPKGTTGIQLDTLARQFLWQEGLDYGHGTGHGVGYFLNVHEPPQGYSTGTASRATTSLSLGMLSSNEPGYYKDGAYGIRIENLIIVEESDYKGFYRHRTLTYFPLDTTLIDLSMMSATEIKWINDYHQKVKFTLLPKLSGELAAWMEQKCQLI